MRGGVRVRGIAKGIDLVDVGELQHWSPVLLV